MKRRTMIILASAVLAGSLLASGLGARGGHVGGFGGASVGSLGGGRIGGLGGANVGGLGGGRIGDLGVAHVDGFRAGSMARADQPALASEGVVSLAASTMTASIARITC